jgi:hypothetical protein
MQDMLVIQFRTTIDQQSASKRFFDVLSSHPCSARACHPGVEGLALRIARATGAGLCRAAIVKQVTSVIVMRWVVLQPVLRCVTGFETRMAPLRGCNLLSLPDLPQCAPPAVGHSSPTVSPGRSRQRGNESEKRLNVVRGAHLLRC